VLGDLFLALRTSGSGLIANQQALDAVAQNVANVNTPGYTRKTVNQEARVLDGNGAGVDISGLTRNIDEGLLKSLRVEMSTLESVNTQETYLGRIQDLFGSPDSNTSFSHTIGEFQAALEALTVSPSDVVSQLEVVRQGDNVANSLRSLSSGIQTLRQDADQRIGAAVDEINALTAQIAELNTQISRNGYAGHDVTGLQDQRDLAIDNLTKLIDIQAFNRSDGSVVVLTASGQTLVNRDAVTLSHTPAAQLGASIDYAGGGIDGIYAGEALPANDITNDIRSGELAALIELRDTTLPGLQVSLDELAVQMRDTVNQVHNRGAPFPGLSSATGTREFADPTTSTVTFQATGDTRLAVFDASGNQVATTTVRTLLGGAGPATIEDVRVGINGWLSTNGSATFDADGRLQITMSAGRTIAFRDEAAVNTAGSTPQDATLDFDVDGDTATDETVSGFSNFFGLNDFFVDAATVGQAGASSTLAVRADIISAPERVSTGAAQWDASAGLLGAYQFSSGDNSVIEELATAFSSGASFAQAGQLPATATGFADYAALIIGKTSSDASTAESRSAYQEELVSTLQFKSDGVRGVNLDEELSDLMLYEQAYSAAARVISVVQEMFDALERTAA